APSAGLRCVFPPGHGQMLPQRDPEKSSRSNLMPVNVMAVRRVPMGVPQRGVLMPMGVRLPDRVARPMVMSMMLVVHVRMRVAHRLVRVLMLMPFGDMEPHAQSHQGAGRQEPEGDALSEGNDREHRTEEGRGREIGAGSRGAEVSKGEHIKRE